MTEPTLCQIAACLRRCHVELLDWCGPSIPKEYKNVFAWADQVQAADAEDFSPAVAAVGVANEHARKQQEASPETGNVPATASFPNPLTIKFGDGRILISKWKSEEGFGVMLQETETRHEVGSDANQPPIEGYAPKAGDILLSFSNLESVKVVIECLEELLPPTRKPTAEAVAVADGIAERSEKVREASTEPTPEFWRLLEPEEIVVMGDWFCDDITWKPVEKSQCGALGDECFPFRRRVPAPASQSHRIAELEAHIRKLSIDPHEGLAD